MEPFSVSIEQNIPEQLGFELVDKIHQRAIVSELNPVGLACRNGIEIGDQLISINGKTVQNQAAPELIAQLGQHLHDNGSVHIQVHRPGFKYLSI